MVNENAMHQTHVDEERQYVQDGRQEGQNEHQEGQNWAPKWTKNDPKTIQTWSNYEVLKRNSWRSKKCSWRLPGAKSWNLS